MATLESLRAAAERKRCPFGVAERCVTTDCAAWKEGRSSDTTRRHTGNLEVSYEREAPGTLFGGLFGTNGWERVPYDTQEIGGIDHDTGRDDSETITLYRWERQHPDRVEVVASGSVYAYCSKL